MEPMTCERVFEIRDSLLAATSTWLLGLEKPATLYVNGQFMLVKYTDKITSTPMLGQAHFLLIGGTGRGKTDLAVSSSLAMKANFDRIQGDPDLRVSDILGGNEILEILKDGNSHKEIAYVPGKIFNHILLVDENNRIPPKTISALLEGMEERSVTPRNNKVSFETMLSYKKILPLFPLSGDLNDSTGPRWFSVSLTQNPFGEEDGAYPTPQAQWDRITMTIELPRPSFEDEMKITSENVIGKKIEPVTDLYEMLAAAQYIYDKTKFNIKTQAYKVQLIRNTDPDPAVEKSSSKLAEFVTDHIELEKGASPRVEFHLEAAARVCAFFAGDTIVKPEHVKQMAPYVIAHRIKLVAKKRNRKGVNAKTVFEEIMAGTPLPRW